VGATGKSDVPKIVDKVRCNDIVDSCLLLTDFEEVMFCHTILLASTYALSVTRLFLLTSSAIGSESTYRADWRRCSCQSAQIQTIGVPGVQLLTVGSGA